MGSRGSLVALLALAAALAAGWWLLAPGSSGPSAGDGPSLDGAGEDGEADAATLASGARKAAPETPRPRGATVAVVGVVRRDGKPVAARVEAHAKAPRERGVPAAWARRASGEVPVPGAAAAPPTGTARAGEGGRYALDGLAPGSYEIVAVAEDGARGWADVSVPCAGGVGEADVDLFGGPETLVGRVTRADGKPFTGHVTALPVDETRAHGLRLVPVAPDGKFTIDGLPRGAVAVHAIVEGSLRVASRPVSLPQRGEVLIVVGAGWVPFAGRVASESGKPIAGAVVESTLDVSSGSVATAYARAVTDAEGAFSTYGSTTWFHVRVTAAGFAPFDRWYSEPAAGPVDLRLAAAGRVVGRVVAQGTGKPVADVSVYVVRMGDADGAGARGKSDAEGRFEVEATPSGEVAVVGFGAGWASPSLLEATTEQGEWNPLAAEVPAGGSATLEVVVAKAGRGGGRVLDPTGKPVVGAVVFWRVVKPGGARHGRLGWLEDALGVATGDDGAFAFDTLPPGQDVRFEALAAGYAPASAGPFAVAESAAVTGEIRLAAPRFADVTVVEVEGGKPVPGATAALKFETGKGEERQRQAVTGPDGVARVTGLPPGECLVYAAAPAHLNASEERVGGPDGSTEPIVATVRLAPSFTITGRVRQADGTVPPSATIMLEEDTGNASGFSLAADGTFTFTDVKAGAYEVVVYVDDDWNEGTRKSVRAGASDVEIVVPTTTRRTLVVRVLGPDGAPVPLADLSHDGTRWGSGTEEVRDGRAEIREVKDEALSIEVRRPRTATGAPLPYGPASVSQVSAAKGEVELRLPAERRIEGVVRDPTSGAGVRGVRVGAKPSKGAEAAGGGAVEQGSARTDDQGRFRLGSLGEGEFSLTVSAPPSYAPTPETKAVSGATDVVILLVPGRAASPTIVDPRGRPVAGARVTIGQERVAPQRTETLLDGSVVVTAPQWHPGHGGGWNAERVSDAAGIVRFVGIPPDGSLWLNAEPPEDRPDLSTTRVTPWAPSDGAVSLTAGLVIRGVVRDRAGRPVAGAEVSASGQNASQTAESRSDGRFVLGGLPEGEMKVRANKQGDFGGESATVTTRAGTDGVVLVVDPGGEVVVRIEGWPADRAQEWVTLTTDEEGDDGRWARVMADGTVTFRGCPPTATYRCVVRLDGEPPRVGMLRDVRVGSATPLRLVLGPGREVTGKVTAPAGASGLSVRVQGAGLWAEGAVDAEGKFTVRAIPEGTWTVHATGTVNGAPYEAKAEAAAGTSVDLTLAPAAKPPSPGEAACGGGKCG